MSKLNFIIDELTRDKKFMVKIEKKSIWLYYLALLDGLLFITLGVFKNIKIFELSLSKTFIIIGIIFISLSIYKLFYPSYRLKYIPTNSWMKYKFVYLNENNTDFLISHFNTLNIKEILSYKTKQYSSLTLDIFYTPDGKLFYYQINKTIKRNIFPLTIVKITYE